MNSKKKYFVSGIDTDAGKSVVTGVLAREWAAEGGRVATQKLVQTGVAAGGLSEDILTHRRIMGIDPLPEDLDRTTCPLIFSYPASPHLAARLENCTVDLSLAERSTDRLLETYDTVLIEGAGGLMVPLAGFYTTLDYIVERRIPLILVTTPRLGSINHTLLSLEACRQRGVELPLVVYNRYPVAPQEIVADTRDYLQAWLGEYFPGTRFGEVDDRMRLTGGVPF